MITLPALRIKSAFLADERSESSVTVVSIVRLTYLIRFLSPDFSTFDIEYMYLDKCRGQRFNHLWSVHDSLLCSLLSRKEAG